MHVSCLDATPEDADWTKQTWDLPPYKSKEFFEVFPYWQLDHFRTMPVYKHAVEQGLIMDDEWMADFVTVLPDAKKWDYATNEDCPHCGAVLRKAAIDPKLGRTRAWVLAHEKPLKKALREVFAGAGEQVATAISKRLTKADLARLLRKAEDYEMRAQEILDSLDLSALSKAMRKQLREVLEGAFKAGVSDGVLSVGVAIDKDSINRANAKSVEYSEARSAELVGMKLIDGQWVENPNPVYSISEATREGLRSLTENAILEGQGAAELKEKILDSYFFSEKRAETIARTELAFAHVQGSLGIWKEWGNVGGKSSILADTHPAPDECDENEDVGIIPLDAEFPSGDLAPPYHPNCLCGLLPYLHDEMPKADE